MGTEVYSQMQSWKTRIANMRSDQMGPVKVGEVGCVYMVFVPANKALKY